MDNKKIIVNIYRIQTHALIMRRYFCIGFTDSTNLFSPNNFKVMIDYFKLFFKSKLL